MSRLYTVDASVFLNAFLPHESGHAESSSLLTYLHETSTPIIVPSLLLPEVAGTIARGQGDFARARAFAAAVASLPHLILVPLDGSLADEAADVAAQHRLRGSDAVYVAVALRFGSILVTRDREQLERAVPVVDACSPSEALADAP